MPVSSENAALTRSSTLMPRDFQISNSCLNPPALLTSSSNMDPRGTFHPR